MKEIESIAAALFDKIRSRFDNITLGDEKAKAVTDPEKARFYNFAYVDRNGEDHGKITISLIDETSLKIYYGQNISGTMDREQRQEWYEFLRGIRQFAKRNLLTFDTRDIGKTNLELQDVKQQSKTDDVATADEVQVTESKLYGSQHRSYADMGECRLLIRHSGSVNDEVRGDRARRIHEIFLETNRGERFLLPFTSLDGARAIAQHVNHGGETLDEFSQHICELVQEMAAMRHFVRSTKHRQFEDAETSQMSQAAVQRYDEIKRTLRHMRGAKGYKNYFENYIPEEAIEDQVDVDALKERFVKKIYDERFTDALPYVYKAYQKGRKNLGSYGEEFDEWADTVAEDIWARPDDEEKVKALEELIKTPIHVGIDGIDAQSKIEPIVGDDDLNDQLYELSQSQGPDADARMLLKNWLKEYMPELLNQVKFGDHNGDTITNYAQPVSPAVQNTEFGAERPPGDVGAAAQMTMEDEDPLIFLKSLAGIK